MQGPSVGRSPATSCYRSSFSSTRPYTIRS